MKTLPLCSSAINKSRIVCCILGSVPIMQRPIPWSLRLNGHASWYLAASIVKIKHKFAQSLLEATHGTRINQPSYFRSTWIAFIFYKSKTAKNQIFSVGSAQVPFLRIDSNQRFCWVYNQVSLPVKTVRLGNFRSCQKYTAINIKLGRRPHPKPRRSWNINWCRCWRGP